MSDSVDNGNQSPLWQRPVIKYGMYVILLAVLVAEMRLAASAWLPVQTVAGLSSGVVLVGTMSFFFERTTPGQLAEETFQQNRLLTSLVVAVLLTAGGIVVSFGFDSNPRVFLRAFVPGMVGGMFILDGIADYHQ